MVLPIIRDKMSLELVAYLDDNFVVEENLKNGLRLLKEFCPIKQKAH